MKKNVFISYNHAGEAKSTISKLSSDLEKLGMKYGLIGTRLSSEILFLLQ